MNSNIEYGLLRRTAFKPGKLRGAGTWDVVISAFNQSQRVREPFDELVSTEKHWIVHPEYDFGEADLPTNGYLHRSTARDEAEFWYEYFTEVAADGWNTGARICIDITGFMRPHLMLALRLFRDRGFDRIWMIYSDPMSYAKGAKTHFTKGAVTEVRQVRIRRRP
ncbi:MAG: hypothetical protein R2711_18410 [Acidimicrobiales bacterium]